MRSRSRARVRELVGYVRYDTEAELDRLNEIRELDRTFTNCLLPQQKLIDKHSHAAEAIKKHGTPATPHQRGPARADAQTPGHPDDRVRAH